MTFDILKSICEYKPQFLCNCISSNDIYEVNLPYKLIGQLKISRYEITLLAIQSIFSEIHTTTNIRLKVELFWD